MDWQSQLLFFSSQHRSPQVLCAQSPSVHTVHHDCTSRHREKSIVKYGDNTFIIGPLKTTVRVHIRRNSTILQHVAQRKICCSNICKTKELIFDLRKKMVEDRKALQWTIKTTQKIFCTYLSHISGISEVRFP